MVNDLAESFYDNVAVPCPSCNGQDVTVYSYTSESDIHIVEGVCGDCRVRWSIV